MARSDLSDLVGGASEDLGVEYKAWIDTSIPETRAKLARHIAALANHGGGYLIFGVDDKTRRPLGANPFDAKLFSQEAMAGIVKKYLDPRVQLQVEDVELDGVSYPVLIVPSHGPRPVIAGADGPRTGNAPAVGVRQGEIYIRVAGPASEAIRAPDDWNGLLDRCLSHRSDLLGKILRQSIAKPSRPSSEASKLLLAAVEDTARDFAEQVPLLAAQVAAPEKARIQEAGSRFCAFGYALLDEDGELVEAENPRGLNDRVSVAMHRYAYDGWSSFLPLSVPERAPQIRTAALLGHDRTYLEGMRLVNTGIVTGTVDYWRLYEAGVAVTVESYREDWVRAANGGVRYVSTLLSLFRLHSILAHARLLGQELPGVHQVVFRQDWRGMSGRALMWGEDNFVSPLKVVDDRFGKIVIVPWAELRDDYFAALRRMALPFFALFASPGWLEPERWLTRELVEREFVKLRVDTVRLFED